MSPVSIKKGLRSGMIEKTQQFLKTSGGRIAAIALFILAIGLAVYSYRGATADSRFSAASRNRLFICSETGKTFAYTIQAGDTFPVLSPHSGKPTGYQAEMCYWTADGKTKDEPTPVLRNRDVGKRGATFCQDCGRLVISFNPPPEPGMKPPPKRDEHKGGAVDIES